MATDPLLEAKQSDDDIINAFQAKLRTLSESPIDSLEDQLRYSRDMIRAVSDFTNTHPDLANQEWMKDIRVAVDRVTVRLESILASVRLLLTPSEPEDGKISAGLSSTKND